MSTETKRVRRFRQSPARAESLPKPRTYGPPNRLSDRTREVIRDECAPMLKHLAEALDVGSSQVSRELDGERVSEFAKTEQRLLGLAAHPKTTPFPLLAYWIARCGEAAHVPGGSLVDHYRTLTRRETLAQGLADVEQVVSQHEVTPEALEAVESALLRHVGHSLSLLALIPRLREEIA